MSLLLFKVYSINNKLFSCKIYSNRCLYTLSNHLVMYPETASSYIQSLKMQGSILRQSFYFFGKNVSIPLQLGD